MNGFSNSQAHFVLVPLMAQGHMIPMVDMACLLAERGARISLITTPVNAARIKPVIDGVKASGLRVEFIELRFPCAEVGLPEGCENVDLLPSKELYKNFFDALPLLREPLELYLQAQEPGPICMITDFCNSWTAEVARKRGIPRLIFHGPSCFWILCLHLMTKNNVYEGVKDEFEPIVVPGFPQRIETTKAQAPGWFNMPGWEKLHDETLEAEATADGVVINSFDDLERLYVECYKKAAGKKVWTVGPLCLYNKDSGRKAARGNKAALDEHRILSWLDEMEPRSVLYVSFGSIARFHLPQLMELGQALEVCNRPFVWVMKEASKSPEVERWLSEGSFEERTSGRGLIIRGWAPQMLILTHPSVGGFLTHCGWNSMLEAVAAGVPMATWPHFADQFLNEKLVVEILGVGVPVGVKKPVYLLADDAVEVKREDVERAVSRLMDGGEEGEERMKRVQELAEKARTAMEEGGSSHENIALLVRYASGQEILDWSKTYAHLN